MILIIAVLVGAIVGSSFSSHFFSKQKYEPKVFSENGMTITLTNEFKEKQLQNYTNAYDSEFVAVFALKESFDLFEGFEDYSLDDYGKLVLDNNNLTSVELKKIAGLTGFQYEYTNPDANDTYKYFSFVYKTNDAFWLVQFATLKEHSSLYYKIILDWAKSITFE